MTWTISNRKVAQAINSGRAQMHLDWPTERLGEYGSNATTDAAMDLYVGEVVAESLRQVNEDFGGCANLTVIGSCAGRHANGRPVIVVTLARA